MKLLCAFALLILAVEARHEIGFSIGFRRPMKTTRTTPSTTMRTTTTTTTMKPMRKYVPFFWVHKHETTTPRPTTTTSTTTEGSGKPPYIPYYPWNFWYRPVHRRTHTFVQQPTPDDEQPASPAEPEMQPGYGLPKPVIWRPLYQIRHKTVTNPPTMPPMTDAPTTTTMEPSRMQYYVPIFKRPFMQQGPAQPEPDPMPAPMPMPMPQGMPSTFYSIDVSH